MLAVFFFWSVFVLSMIDNFKCRGYNKRMKKQKLSMIILSTILAIGCSLNVGCSFLDPPKEDPPIVNPSDPDQPDQPQEPDPIGYSVTVVCYSDGVEIKRETIETEESTTIEYTCPKIENYVFIEWQGEIEEETVFLETKEGKNLVFAYYDSQYAYELPVVYITTEDKNTALTKNYVSCSVSVNSSLYPVEERSATIKCRGNTSFAFADKKSYHVKFDKKVSLCGAKARKNYNLIANYFDKTLARNSFAYELANRLDGIDYSSTHEWVEVYVNGVYDGVYLLCDQIQTGDGRVDIDESMDDLDTGYLVEANHRIVEDPNNYIRLYLEGYFYEMKTPSFDLDEKAEALPYQLYIQSYMAECITAIRTGTWEEVCELVDLDSFVDSYIVYELMGNVDVDRYSFYLYKEKGGKLFAGPVWDFDLSGGNVSYKMGNSSSCPADQSLYVKENTLWYGALMNRPEFSALVSQRLHEKESLIRSTLKLLDTTSNKSYLAHYGEAITRNFDRWKMSEIVKNWYYENREVSQITTVEGQYDYLYRWLNQRLEYMLNVIQ